MSRSTPSETESTTTRYSGQEKAKKEVNNILRMTTADGFEGVSRRVIVFDRRTGLATEHLIWNCRTSPRTCIALQSLEPVSKSGRYLESNADPT